MFKILQHPKDVFITQLVPWQSLCIQPESMVQVAIQVNIFYCGGIAFGFQFPHKIIDAATMISLLNTWASLALKSCKKIEFPNFVASSIFPPIHLSPGKNVPPLIGTCFLKEGNHVGRRFVFDATAVAKLKAKATSTCVTNPSRVQVVTAFILKCCMAASKAVFGSPRASVAHHAVNVRSRMMPPLPENLVGSLLSKVSIRLTSSDLEFNNLVASIRSAFGKINADYVKSLQGHQRLEVLCETLREAEKIFDREKMDSYFFSSWCNMGFHSVNFGWGKPIWATSIAEKLFPQSFFVNSCWLLDTREGDGVEALLILDEKEMDILECDAEFLEFVLQNLVSSYK
ncbi:hypothetical protein RJ641_036327 [Dillenia turbinata]|uniref:Uncharacterized protein n=1 Tax=Dillenia turbinata TaxID=194707 RepID=A0AAN8VT09_9MAGN